MTKHAQLDSANGEATQPGVRARLLARGLDVLFLLAKYPEGAKLVELASNAQLSQATVLRILRTMIDRDVVSYSQHHKTYALGPAILALSARARADNLLLRAARDTIDELARETGETAALFQRAGNERVCIAATMSNHDLGYRIEPGQRRSADSGSGGVVLISGMRSADRDLVLGALSADRRQSVLRQLAMLEHTGVVLSQDEVVKGVTGVAAPIRDHSEELIASLAVIGPTARFDRSSIEACSRLVREHAADISRALGSAAKTFVDAANQEKDALEAQ